MMANSDLSGCSGSPTKKAIQRERKKLINLVKLYFRATPNWRSIKRWEFSRSGDYVDFISQDRTKGITTEESKIVYYLNQTGTQGDGLSLERIKFWDLNDNEVEKGDVVIFRFSEVISSLERIAEKANMRYVILPVKQNEDAEFFTKLGYNVKEGVGIKEINGTNYCEN